MPYIATKVSTTISTDKEEVLAKKFGKAIALIGKPEAYLMLDFQEKCHLYYAGNKNADTAIVEVKLLGKATRAAYESLTAELTTILNTELGIPGERIFVKYDEVEHWGCNGKHF